MHKKLNIYEIYDFHFLNFVHMMDINVFVIIFLFTTLFLHKLVILSIVFMYVSCDSMCA